VFECFGDFLRGMFILLKLCESDLDNLVDFLYKSHEPGFDLDASLPEIFDKLSLLNVKLIVIAMRLNETGR
jgi:hypothetical protein